MTRLPALRSLLAVGLALHVVAAFGCRSAADDVVVVPRGRTALTHVTVVDGTGRPAQDDQTVVIDGDRIIAVGPTTDTPVPPEAQIFNLPDHTVIPGLVGMHDHLFYVAPGSPRQISDPSALARLYLAAGVTTIRTGGTIDLDADIRLKRAIDDGREVGPAVVLTSPYFGDLPPEAVPAAVETLAGQGVAWLKVYTQASPDMLDALVQAAHQRGLKVMGHLCGVGFREAVARDIDTLEHGVLVDSEFYPGRKRGECPEWSASINALRRVGVPSTAIDGLIADLVTARVAITSTLSLFESFTRRPAFYDTRAEAVLAWSAREAYRREVQLGPESPQSAGWSDALQMEMVFERRFVKAGGHLVSGADPTGWGGALAGLADQRNVELLVEAGFTPEEAIQIATANGAATLGIADRVGTIAPGKIADLVLVQGNPAARIRDIQHVMVVFKNGIGYDGHVLLQSARGSIGVAIPRLWLAIASGPALALVVAAVTAIRRRLAERSRHPRSAPGSTGAR
jgi:imidazolonepropionase-like amidohydrolase